jgi:hypothetical protein
VTSINGASVLDLRYAFHIGQQAEIVIVDQNLFDQRDMEFVSDLSANATNRDRPQPADQGNMAFFSQPSREHRHGGLSTRYVLCAWFALGSALLVQSAPGNAEEAHSTTREKKLKVVFFYNFALCTQWPMPLDDGLTFCVLRRDDLGATLDALASRQINKKSVILRRLDAHVDLTSCHMVYFTAASDDDATIRLERDGNRLVFDINNTDAYNVGRTLSCKLLRLARSVH